MDTEETDNKKDEIALELGDIIQIESPSNDEYHEQTFLIQYIDDHTIHLINISTYQEKTLSILDNKQLSDESITQISLLSRSEEKGYARQNALLPKTWVDIHFGGEFPAVITGEITNLEEDMIEVTTYPSIQVLYIDFEYKGIPPHIPIESIRLRDRPATVSPDFDRAQVTTEELGDCAIQQEEATIEFTETGESVISIPETAKPNANIDDTLHQIYLDAADIFGDELEAITLEIEVPESQKRYGIDAQTNDLMDELLSTVPNHKRTKRVMDNITLLLERFKELRQKFSKFDGNGNVADAVYRGVSYKPLLEKLRDFNCRVQWAIPVVTNRKKLYVESGIPDEDIPDVINIDLETSITDQYGIQRDFAKNKQTGIGNYYAKMHSSLNDAMTPFDAPLSSENMLVYNQEIRANIDCIVNNLDNFTSTARITGQKKMFQDRSVRFLIERYNLGIDRVESTALKHGKKVFVRKMMMPSDKVSLKSILLLPEPVMHASRVDLPGTTLLHKVQLSQTPLQLYRLLRKSTAVRSHVVENLNAGVVYKEENSDDVSFLKDIVEYKVDPDVIDPSFEKLLNNVLPETGILIQMMQKYMTDQLSVVDATKLLEPFYVYPEDLAYQHYNNIRYFLKNRLKSYRTKLSEKEQEMSKMRNQRIPRSTFVNFVTKTFAEKSDFLHVFIDAYKMRADKIEEYSNGELLSKMMEMDNGVMFDTLLSRMVLSLTTPNKLFDGLEHPVVEDMGKIDKIKPMDCARRFITKKYVSITEMQKDNNSDTVYYDKDYDDTPYHILKKYTEKHKKLSSEDFVEFLAENLIQKHDCNGEFSKELATTLIAGKKTVKEGEYAILEITPKLPDNVDQTKLTKAELAEIESEGKTRARTHYYKRLKNNWVRDESVNEESFMDTQSLFCNSDNSCYKNQQTQLCDTMGRAKPGLRNVSHAKVFAELDKRMAMTVEEMEQKLEKELEDNRKQISRNAALRHVSTYKQNMVSYELGKQTVVDEQVVSPYANLRDLIMSQDDFIKKQNDLCWFVGEYCREAMVAELKENPYWLYCKETNTKLLPESIRQLAVAFVYGDYQTTLDELCHTHGTESMSDAIYDKHTGYMLRKIDFVQEDEYDDAGFKITSHSIIEKDIAQIISEIGTQKERAQKERAQKSRVFDDEIDQMTYNVFLAIAINTGISPELVEEFVMRCSLELIRNRAVINTEETYNAKREESMKKTDKAERVPVVWPIYRNQKIIAIIGAVTLIAAQTVIPTIKTRKTYPGCVKSFSGYPMSGIEDVSGIKYIACILNGSKNDEAPWKDIQKLNVPVLATRIKEVLDQHILKRNDVQDLYARKREYLILLPDEVVPQEHAVEKWTSFLPPVVEIGVISGLRNVSADFKKEVTEELRKGHKDQHADINMLKTKINAHVYGMIEHIYNIVHQKDLLLQTAAKKPFLQNACCNEPGKSTHPISYFMAENPAIEQYIHVANDLGKTLNDICELSKAAMFYHPASTWSLYPPMPAGQTEQNIYGAVIHYGKYDRGVSVPEDYKAICGDKPAGYQSFWSIEEKTEFLKKNGKRFDEEALKQLMDRVNQNNMVTANLDAANADAQIAKLSDFLQEMESKDSQVIEHPLRNLMGHALAEYKHREMKKEGTVTAITNLRRYLGNANRDLLSEIVDFMKSYGNVDLQELNRIQLFMANIHVWDMDKKTDAIYTVCHFMRNSIEAFSKTYASMIMNEAEYNKIHKHWSLSKFHYSDISAIMSQYLAILNKYKKDESITRLLQEVQENTADILTFLQHIPIETPIHKNDATYFELFDKKTLYLLHVYCYYSIFYEYMKASMDDDMLHFDIQEIRREKRAAMSEVDQSSNPYEVNEATEDEARTLQEYDVRGGDKEAFQKRICSLMIDFITIDSKNKSNIDKPYEEISRKNRKSKQEEKKAITDYLENIEKDERKVEDTLKQLKLGRWNVGIQKGVFMYDKNTYDNERNALLTRLEQDLTHEVMEPEMMETLIQDLEREADDDAAQYDDEGTDIRGFGDDYLDGNFYGDEGDDDFNED